MTDSGIEKAKPFLANWNAPWTVDGLPAGFDTSDERFNAARFKWNMDRDGQDWPNPRYAPVVSNGVVLTDRYMLCAEVVDRVDGAVVWAMEVRR